MNNIVKTTLCRVIEVNFSTKQVERIIEVSTDIYNWHDEYTILILDMNEDIQEVDFITSEVA